MLLRATAACAVVTLVLLGSTRLSAREEPSGFKGVTINIRASDSRYECADVGIASVIVDLELEIVNTTSRPLAIPVEGIDVGDEHYWKATEADGREPQLIIEGKLRATSGVAPPALSDDFVVLAVGGRHKTSIAHGLVVARDGKLGDGVLIPGDYRAELVVEPTFTLAQDTESLRRLQAGFGSLWLTAEWSRPFEFSVGAFPDKLPSCMPR